MGMTFHYGRRNGWIECGLTFDDVAVLHPVNGWHDGLREVIVAACEIMSRTSEATAFFQDEPGEYRWRISRLVVNRIRARVIEFDDWGTGLPDERGKLLLDKPCGMMTFARAIHKGSA